MSPPLNRPVVLHVAAVEFTASRLLQPQMSYLAGLGYEVRLACAPDGQDFAENLRPFQPVPLRFPRSLDPIAMATASRSLRRIVRELRPAVVHFHSPSAALPGRAALTLGRQRPAVVYTVHGFLHQTNEPSRTDRLIDRAERWLSRVTDALMFQSGEDYGHAVATGYKGRLVMLGNGVGEEWFTVPRPKVRTGPLRVAFVGRLTREKGMRELLAATGMLPDVRWTLIGDALASDRESMSGDVRRVAAASEGSIEALGMVDQGAVRAHLADADLLVLPSWREGVPRSVIEGMAMGLPVVATDIRGCRELVVPGVNGWLVPARNSNALANAVREAAASPRERLLEMGDAGRAMALKNNRERDVFNRIAETYRDLGVVP